MGKFGRFALVPCPSGYSGSGETDREALASLAWAGARFSEDSSEEPLRRKEKVGFFLYNCIESKR